MYPELKWHVAVNKFNLNSNLRTLLRQGSFFILTFLSLSIINATQSINNIQIVGNKNTKSSIILREIFHPIPGEFDTLLSIEDRNRIYNLNIFSTVEIYPQDTTYKIFVNETPLYYPIPLIDYNDAKGWSYGLGILTDNFRGLNESVIGGAMFGEDPVYFLRYSNPWIWDDHIGLTLDLLNINSDHHVYDLLKNEKAFYIGSGLKWKKFHNTFGTIGWIDRKIESISNKEIKTYQLKHIVSQFNYKYDSRDIKIDPTIGHLLSIKLESNWGIDSSPTTHAIEIYSQFYFSPTNLKIQPIISYTFKSIFQFSNNELPYYQKSKDQLQQDLKVFFSVFQLF